jgi:hypothetical protein
MVLQARTNVHQHALRSFAIPSTSSIAYAAKTRSSKAISPLLKLTTVSFAPGSGQQECDTHPGNRLTLPKHSPQKLGSSTSRFAIFAGTGTFYLALSLPATLSQTLSIAQHLETTTTLTSVDTGYTHSPLRMVTLRLLTRPQNLRSRCANTLRLIISPKADTYTLLQVLKAGADHRATSLSRLRGVAGALLGKEIACQIDTSILDKATLNWTERKNDPILQSLLGYKAPSSERSTPSYSLLPPILFRDLAKDKPAGFLHHPICFRVRPSFVLPMSVALTKHILF